MDAAQWPQQIGGFAKAMEEITTPNSNNNNNNSREVERRATRPQKEQNVNCPRCNSTNTKFCYYNNYSLTQPRYFCKTCRRYWTQGGSLRNVPVGGGSRKNKRSSSSSSSASSMLASSSSSSSLTQSSSMPTKLIPDLNPPNSLSHHFLSQNPKFLQGQDLNLAFPIQGIFHPMDHHQFPKIETNNNSNNNNNNENIHSNISTTDITAVATTTTSSTPISALELLRTGIASRGTNLSSYLTMPMAMPPDSNNIYHSSGLIPNLHEFKLHHDDHHHHHHEVDSNMLGSSAANNGGARLLFPFADMNKLASPTTTTTTNSTQHHEIDDQSKAGNDDDHHHHNNNHNQAPNGYWTGMLGGGTW